MFKITAQEKELILKQRMVKAEDKPDFETALASFMKGAQEIINKYWKEVAFKGEPHKLELERGKKYIRIVQVDSANVSRSAWGFIDTTNGDVLKAAGWKIPAKKARGNIFDSSNGLKTIGPYGPAYLR
jgi:hypothetical protein